MDSLPKIKAMQKNFRILKGWKISRGSPNEWTGRCFVSPSKKCGEVYPYGSKDVPSDYLAHEMLHFALRALLRMDRRKKKELFAAEEGLIQDICSLLSRGLR